MSNVVAQDDVNELREYTLGQSNEITKSEVIAFGIQKQYLRKNHDKLSEYDQKDYFKEFIMAIRKQASAMFKESLHNKRRDIYCWVKLKELYFQKMRTFDEKALRQRINLIVKLNNLSDLTADEKKEIMDYANRHGITTILGFLK
jgi:hypothetical protein